MRPGHVRVELTPAVQQADSGESIDHCGPQDAFALASEIEDLTHTGLASRGVGRRKRVLPESLGRRRRGTNRSRAAELPVVAEQLFEIEQQIFRVTAALRQKQEFGLAEAEDGLELSPGPSQHVLT